MQLSEIPKTDAWDLLNDGLLKLTFGPFCVRVKSDILHFNENFYQLYRNHSLASENTITDFSINISKPKNLRRFFKPQVIFNFEDIQPFLPLPLVQAMPMFEWGLNWCIANHAHQYLQFHAAGLAKDNVLVVMPAPPGSGKSTLTAALMNQGWQLFSDEIVLIDLKSGLAVPISRPINLKNNSIDLLSKRYPSATVTPKFKDTVKGTVALMAPDQSSIKNSHKPQKATHIIYPKYEPDTELYTEEMDKSDAFMDLITNSFNYHILQEEGFKASLNVCRQTQCLKLTYSKIDQAIDFFDSLEAE